MHATLYEADGFICLETPRGTLVFRNYTAHDLGYATMEQARRSVSKESDDPDRQRRTPFELHEIIDPDPDTAHGGICAAQTTEGSGLARESGSDAGGGDG